MLHFQYSASSTRYFKPNLAYPFSVQMEVPCNFYIHISYLLISPGSTVTSSDSHW